MFGIATVGQAFGPLIGGGLTALIDWRAVLLVNVPVCAAVVVLTLTSVDESRDETVPRAIDWSGLGLVIASIACFTYAVDKGSDWGWTSAPTLGLMAIGIIGIGALVAVERRVRYPLIDLSLFRIREFDLMIAAGTVGNMGTSTAIFTSMILLQSVDGMSAGGAGVAFLGFSLGVAASSQLSGRVARFPSWQVMSVALLSGGVGAIALAGGLAVFILGSVFGGLGFGMTWAFTSVSTQAVVPAQKAGEASGVVLTILVTLGGVAIAIASSIIESSSGANGPERALEGVLIGAGSLALAASATVALLGRRALAAADPPVAPEPPRQGRSARDRP